MFQCSYSARQKPKKLFLLDNGTVRLTSLSKIYLKKIEPNFDQIADWLIHFCVEKVCKIDLLNVSMEIWKCNKIQTVKIMTNWKFRMKVHNDASVTRMIDLKNLLWQNVTLKFDFTTSFRWKHFKISWLTTSIIRWSHELYLYSNWLFDVNWSIWWCFERYCSIIINIIR